MLIVVMNRQWYINIFIVVCVFDFCLNILFRVSKASKIASFILVLLSL
jgi:hypothetical protein